MKIPKLKFSSQVGINARRSVRRKFNRISSWENRHVKLELTMRRAPRAEFCVLGAVNADTFSAARRATAATASGENLVILLTNLCNVPQDTNTMIWYVWCVELMEDSV